MATGSPFWDLSSYRNFHYALNVEIWDYFSSILFNKDKSRIIYSKSNFAFRKRTNGNHKLNNLDLPFMNFKIDSITQPAKDFQWWSQVTNVNGVYIPDIGRSLRFTPINVVYDATLFCHRYEELLYVYDTLTLDASNQRTLTPVVSVNGFDIKSIAVLGYDLQFNPDYDEQEHLDIADIYSINLGLNFDTFIAKEVSQFDDNGQLKWSVTEKAILDFYGWFNNTDCGLNEKIEYMNNIFC